MSDSATNVPIEDVLSSIRRLVTEEERDPRKRRAESDDTARTPPRLVLTPALRVPADKEESAAVSEPFHLGAEFSTTNSDSGADTDTDIDTGVTEAPQSASQIDPEAPWSDPQVTLHEAAAALSEEEDQAEAEQADEEHPFNGSIAPAEATMARDDAELTDLDVTTSYTVPDVEPAESTDSVNEPEEVVVDAGDVQAEQIEDAETSEEPEPVVDHAPEADTPTESDAPDRAVEEAVTGSQDMRPEFETAQPIDLRTATLNDKIQALEAAIAQTEDQWEPDGDGDGAQSDFAAMPVRTIPWQDDTPDQSSVASEPQIIDGEGLVEPTAEAQNEASDEDAFLDEETLREMVTEIVRQELQGVLGERITRNVRKLVRREIYRAMAAQQLD